MPKFTVRAPDGRSVTLTGDAPPSESELDDIFSKIGPRRPVSAEDFTGQEPSPSAASLMGSGLRGVWNNLNPVAAVEGVYSAVRHPIDTVSNIVTAQLGQGHQAATDFGQGRYSEAIGHGLAAALPLLGPAAARAGEKIGTGRPQDIAEGIGESLGLVAPVAAPAAARGLSRTVDAVAPNTLRASIADSLAAKAAANVADVMTPKVGANKTRFSGLADKVAPEIAADPELQGFWSRQGFHDAIGAKLAGAEEGLDAASDARLSARTFNTDPIIADLEKKKSALMAKSVDASQPEAKVTTRTSPIVDPQGRPITVTNTAAVPVGRDVIPAPNRARAAQIDQAIAELKQLGPVARYDDLRTIRQAYDGPAKAVYHPSMTQDFLTAQGGKMGAADVTGTLREHLAKMDPETAKANVPYSLYRGANDVLDAVAETEKTRPKVGRRIMARLTTTLAGEQLGGAPGAVMGWLVGPAVDSIAASDYTTKLKWAQAQATLARAIRAGDEGLAISASTKLKNLVVSAAVPSVTSPNGLQTNSGLSR